MSSAAERPAFLDIAPVRRFAGSVRLPGSKSISNRTLLLAALADGTTELRGLLDSDDTARMLEALAALGIAVERIGTNACRVSGCAGRIPNPSATLFLGNAGTAFRPLTAALALAGGHYQLSGVARMHERPIGDLVDALRGIGAQIRYTGNEGFPPLAIEPPQLAPTLNLRVRGSVSSQFLTALLLALPITGREATIQVVGELISKPYIAITLALMRRFGVTATRQDWSRFMIGGGVRYRAPGTLWVEGDASSASYFLAAGAILGGPVRVEGVGAQSIQGDVKFTEVLQQMGARVELTDAAIEVSRAGPLRAIDADCNHIPDAAMTAAVLALFAEGTSVIRNIASWRVKETDRIAAMSTELRKVGATVEAGDDFIRITPPAVLRSATIDTYDDHRMAMCFSLVALGGVGVRINDPACVAKTFPEYFSEFESLAVH